MSLKVGDKVVITGGRDKVGKIGIVTDISGMVGGESGAFVAVQMKRCTVHTFFKQSYLTKCK